MVGTTASRRQRFAASDPGLLRLRAGVRAVVGTTLTLGVLTMLRQPSDVLLVGGFTTVVTSLGISSLHPRHQLLTLVAGAPVTIAALALGGMFAPFDAASHLAFLLVISAAVYARRFGRRGLDLGIFAFMAYFLSQFADTQSHQLPRLTGTVTVALAVAAVTRCCLVPATSHSLLTRMRAGVDSHLRDLDLPARCGRRVDVPTAAPDVRDLDQALEAFRTATRPLVHPLNPRCAERTRVRDLVTHLEAASVRTRSLITDSSARG